MSKTPSTMLALGTVAPDFTLPEPATHSARSLADFAEARALVVVFLSNHCPFVRHLADHFSAFASEQEAKGLAVVGIMSNDVEKYPDDAPDKMKEEVGRRGYTFPYLFDESQEVAKAYQAACTPDFFLFDARRELVYREQAVTRCAGHRRRSACCDRFRAGRERAPRATDAERRVQHQVEGGQRTTLVRLSLGRRGP